MPKLPKIIQAIQPVENGQGKPPSPMLCPSMPNTADNTEESKKKTLGLAQNRNGVELIHSASISKHYS